MSRSESSPDQRASVSGGWREITGPMGTFVTAGNARGQNPFAVGLGAQFLAHELLPAGHKVPDVVILDFDHLAFVPKLENYLFYQLFCSAAQDGIGAELGMMNRKIMAYERGGVRAAEADLEKRNEIVARAKMKGFEPILTPAFPAFLSRRLTVLVLDEAQKLRVEELVLNAFIHRDQDYFARLIREFQGRHPELCHLSETTIERITESFARTRSFVSSPGLFFDPKTGKACSDEVIRREKLKAIIDIRMLSAGVQKVTKGAGDLENSIEVSLEGGEVIISENATRLRISREALRPEGLEYRRWRAKGVGIFNGLLEPSDEVPKLINFGTGDALYVGSGEDFTNFAIVCRGRLFLLDPSERTIRNLTDLGLLERIEVIYLSHVHYDHIGGVLELALRFLSGASLPRFRLLTSRVVWLQTRDVLFATTGKDASAFDDCFEVIKPSAILNSAGQPDPEGDVEVVPLLEGAFRGFTCHLMRTYGHPLPTYGLKCVTPHGTLAYLVDSTMPPAFIQGQRNARHDDFLNFFDVRADVDVLIADAGGLEGNKDNVHIAPSELLAVFPEHAWRGTLWTVHSPLTQKSRDLQRYEPFDVIELCPYATRKKRTDFLAGQLLALGAFRNRHFQIGPSQAERLGRVARTRQFRRGDKIIEKHDDVRNPENNKVHIILRGEVSVAEEGREIRAGERLGPGDLFGERAIFGAEVAALAYWQIPERQRAKVLTRHEFESGAYFTWNPALTENDIATEFEQEPELVATLSELFRQTQKLQRTRTAVVLTDKAEVMEIKAPEFFKIFEHFVFTAEDLAADEREEKVRETLGALVLSSSSASTRMRMDDFIALVELDHLTQVMEPIMEMAQAKLAGDRERIKALKWPAVVFASYTRLDPVSRVIDANLSAFLSFASVFHDQYVSEIKIAPYLDPTRATPEVLTRLVAEGALDGESERVQAYIARYGDGRKHVKLQRRDVKQLEPFAQAIAGWPETEQAGGAGLARENATKLLGFFQSFPPTQDVLSSLYAEWVVLMSEIDRAYDKSARDPYKDYLARLQTKAIANILTILLYIRTMKAQGKPLPHLDEILLWIHAAWSLDNDWAEQAGMTWGELEQIKPGDIKKDWVALDAVVEQLDFRADFDVIIAQGRARFPSPLHPEV